jgi:hypothetical protein
MIRRVVGCHCGVTCCLLRDLGKHIQCVGPSSGVCGMAAVSEETVQ